MFTDQALSAEQTFNVGPTTYNPDDTATAVYSGDIFDNSGLPVTFLPNQLQAAYGLPAAYSLGLDRQGGRRLSCWKVMVTRRRSRTPIPISA